MKKYVIYVFFIFMFLAGVGSVPAVAADKDSGNIVLGGHGNITVEGPTGLFLNPTSGILAEGELIVQYCAAILEDAENNNFIGHNAILSYGVTDWLELGGFGVSVDRSKLGSGGGGSATPCGPAGGGPGPGAGAPCPTNNLDAGGPFARIKLVKETASTPEFTVGGISLNGADELTKHTVFVAASKGTRFTNNKFLRSAKLHVGARNFWAKVGPDDYVFYVGVDLELRKNIFLVAEISTEYEGAIEVPWSAGIQVRSDEGYGFSLGFIQPGTVPDPGVFVGVGINFD